MVSGSALSPNKGHLDSFESFMDWMSIWKSVVVDLGIFDGVPTTALDAGGPERTHPAPIETSVVADDIAQPIGSLVKNRPSAEIRLRRRCERW
jgi:hypothetical protein